jgi:hypothetical protein
LGALSGSRFGPWGALGGGICGSLLRYIDAGLIIKVNTTSEISNQLNVYDFVGINHNKLIINYFDVTKNKKTFSEEFKKDFLSLNSETSKLNADELLNSYDEYSEMNFTDNNKIVSYIDSKLENKTLSGEFLEFLKDFDSENENLVTLNSKVLEHENRFISRTDLSESDLMKISVFFSVFRNSLNFWSSNLK